MPLSEFGREYLLLGLRMGKLIDEYIDSYFGPRKLKQLVEYEDTLSPHQLLLICRGLQKYLPDQGFEDLRVRFLNQMLGAMETSLKLEIGLKIPYLEQVKRLYNITPEYRTDSELYEGVEQLDSLYEGSGTLLDRLRVVYKRRELPKNRIIEFCRHGMNIVRERTYKLFPDLLPCNESEEVEEVHNRTWAGYNWYLGNFKSRFDICTDKRISWHLILDITAHEGYPGHHVYSCVTDKLLFQGKNHFEQCMRIAFGPQMVLYEGTASLALDTLFSQYEQERIAYENYCLNPVEENFDDLLEEKRVWKTIRGITANLAFHLYVDGWSEEKLFAFVLELGLMPEAQIHELLNLVKDPYWKTFHFNYLAGERLIKKKYGERLSPKNYTNILINAYLPSDFV